MNDIVMKSMVSEEVWKLKDTDPEGFKARVRAHFQLSFPDWKVTNAKYPFIYLKRDQGLI